MAINNFSDNNFRYSVSGFLTGVVIFVGVLVAEILSLKTGFNFESLNMAYNGNLSLWIVSFSPVILGGLGFFVDNKTGVLRARIAELIESEQVKSAKIKAFVKKLINLETDVEYEINEDEKELGQSLIELRDTIKENKEIEEKRRQEDEQRHWVSEGLAKFGEILRSDNDNMEQLSYKVIKNLVKYVEANQGGFFILNDNDEDDVHFEMTSCYAYDRKKFADKRVNWGEGLIGTCVLEKKTIHLTEIPDSYVLITSGLGKANPTSLLIVPLIVNDEVHGVIELASFKNFEPYEIEFVEKVGESIATTISSVKINMRTSQLLKDSQEQAEALASQEEQMRQNMEELQATQEEATRQSQKFVSFTNSVNHTLIRAEYDTDGTLLYANTKFLKKLGYSNNSEVEGKHISIFINEKDRDWFDSIWENLAKGGRHFEGYMKHMTKQGQDLWTMATYTCVRTEDNEVEKILFLAIDTTDQKKQSLEFEGQINALDRSSLKVIYTSDGKVLELNDRFVNTMEYTIEEAKMKSVYDFLDKSEWNNFKKVWDNVNKGESYEGTLKAMTKNGKEKWLNSTYSAVFDMYGEVSKIIYIGHDITKQKLMEIESQEQARILKEQEEKLRQSEVQLQKDLAKAREEMEEQFEEMKIIKIRNEKTLEGALDSIFTINTHGTIEFFNKAAEELWGMKKRDVIGRDVKILFSEKTMKEDDFVKKLVTQGENKVVGERKEITIKKLTGEEAQVLCLLSDATYEGEHTFTAFIQNVEVELF